jgi:ABC-type lipoprotein release transport system permease subunit
MLTWEFIVPTGAGSTSPLSMLGQPIVYAELAVVLAIAVLASLVPARRALRVDPAVALRHE